MRFTWDEVKRKRNLKDHGFDSWMPSGYSTVPRSLTRTSIVHTDTKDLIHIISFRKATQRETAILFENL
jgi:uncharacterized DUF497 family protein